MKSNGCRDIELNVNTYAFVASVCFHASLLRKLERKQGNTHGNACYADREFDIMLGSVILIKTGMK